MERRVLSDVEHAFWINLDRGFLLLFTSSQKFKDTTENVGVRSTFKLLFFFFLHWSIIQNVLIEEAVLLYKKMVQFWWISVPFTCCYFLIIPLGVTKVRNVQRGFNFKYLHWKYLAAQYWDSVSGMHCIMLDYLDPGSQHHIRDRVKRCMLICILAIIVILIMTANDSSLWLQFCRFTSAETLRHAVTDKDKTKTDFICFCQSVTSGTY